MPEGSQENEKVTGHVDRRPIIDGFAEVRAHAARVGTSTMIDLGAAASGAAGKDVVALTGFRLARLDAADILFA
jgi:hypothetical protein